MDATTFLLTKVSSSEVKDTETQEISSAGYTKVSYQTFVLSLVERQHFFHFHLDTQSFLRWGQGAETKEKKKGTAS